jgi:hypothetical protein
MASPGRASSHDAVHAAVKPAAAFSAAPPLARVHPRPLRRRPPVQPPGSTHGRPESHRALLRPESKPGHPSKGTSCPPPSPHVRPKPGASGLLPSSRLCRSFRISLSRLTLRRTCPAVHHPPHRPRVQLARSLSSATDSRIGSSWVAPYSGVSRESRRSSYASRAGDGVWLYWQETTSLTEDGSCQTRRLLPTPPTCSRCRLAGDESDS